MSRVLRPAACPKPGEVPAFDAGWDAHETGLERETVEMLTPLSGVGWALLGWDARETAALAPADRDTKEGP